MKIFLVGGGDLRAMKIYLAGTNGRGKMIDESVSSWRRNMALGHSERERERVKTRRQGSLPFNILMSFAYPEDTIIKNIHNFNDFLLDSGAYSFMAGTAGKNIDWDEYIDRYASFIKEHNVEKFFELDIDSLVAYEEVRRLRKRLIDKTNKLPIPVWHKSRGREEFTRMCQEFPYVALGGIVTKEIKRSEYKFFPYFINEAHKYNAKIHGLGLTNLNAIKKYKFDSVDSSSWTCGNRFGYVVKFTGSTLKQFEAPNGSRLKNAEKVAKNNFWEWVKFADWAEENL